VVYHGPSDLGPGDSAGVGPHLAVSGPGCAGPVPQKEEMMQARMRQLVHFAVVPVALLVVLSGTILAQGNTSVGTWKLNVAKSKYKPGPPPMSETVVIEAWESDGVKYNETIVAADGTRGTLEFSDHYDGKDYKLTGSPDFDMVAAKRIGANSVAFTLKKAGKVVETGKDVVSRNGKIRTLTVTGTNAKGRKVNIVAVFEKQ
jgi:hypothetical protein